ncbi:hypothetical protein GCM10022293_42540 [Azospirillum formosense]
MARAAKDPGGARRRGDPEALGRPNGEPLSLAASRALAHVQDGAANKAAARVLF